MSNATVHAIHAGHTRLSAGEIAEVENFIVRRESPWFSRNEQIAICRALAGEFIETSQDYFFLLSRDGRLVSHAWYAVSHRTPEAGVLGYVFTDPDWRGRGFSTQVCSVLLDHFATRGGKVMHLGTDSPVAKHTYIKNGFRDYNGHVMRRLAKNMEGAPFDERYFAASVNVTARPAEWGDLAMATCLYTSNSAWIVRDYTEGIVVRPNDELSRCNSIFIALMLRSEISGNSMCLLQTPANRVVGCASIVVRPEAESLVLEFMVHPNFAGHAARFLQGMMPAGKSFTSYASRRDTTKLAILRELGFQSSDDPAAPDEIISLALSAKLPS